MQYQQTPQGLASMFDANVSNGGGSIAYTPSMMQMLGNQQYADQMTQQDQARQLDFDTQNDPLKLARSSLDNQTLQAHLPGIQADSAIKQRTNSNAAATNDQLLQSMRDKFTNEQINSHVENAASAGTLMSQLAVDARNNPLGAKDRVRQALIANGHGDAWHPDWSGADVAPGQFAKELDDYGRQMQETSSALRSKMQVQDLKNTGLLSVAQEKTKAEQEKSASREKIAKGLFENRLAVAQTKESEQSYGVELTKLAQQETDPVKANEYLARANEALINASRLASASAGVVTAPKADINKLGIGSNPPAPMPTVAARPVAAPMPNPSPQASSPSASAPKATKQYMAGSPEAQEWIERAQRANPTMQPRDIMLEGYKQGILK